MAAALKGECKTNTAVGEEHGDSLQNTVAHALLIVWMCYSGQEQNKVVPASYDQERKPVFLVGAQRMLRV